MTEVKNTNRQMTETEYTRVEGAQEDPRILKLQEELKLMMETFEKEKADIKFNEKSDEYQNKKESVKNIKAKLIESNDKAISKKLNAELKDAEAKMKTFISDFPTVNKVEKAILALKDKINKLVKAIEKDQKKSNAQVEKAKHIIESLETLIEKDAIKKLQEENEKTQEVIFELTQEVELILSKGGKPTKQSKEVKDAENKIKENLKLIEKIKNTDKTKAGETI